MVSRRRRSRKAAGAVDDAPGGGAEETRTPDVLLAKEVLYQLSYGPESGSAAFGAAGAISRAKRARCAAGTAPAGEAGSAYSGGVQTNARVGVSGLEPEASALSGQCSNQLS